MAELKSVIELPETASPSSTIEITLQINGAAHALRIEPRVSLLDALREYLGLTGTKKGCNQGRLRSLHSFSERRTDPFVLGTCRSVRRSGDYDGRGTGRRRDAGSSAGRVYRARWISMWILYARTDLFGHRDDSRVSRRFAERCNKGCFRFC